MITNPEAVTDARLKIAQEREDIADNPLDTAKKGVIIVKKLRARNYDAEVERTFRNVETRVVALDAKILPERQLREGGYGPPRHYRSLTEYLTDPQVRRRMAAHYNSKQLREIGEQLIDMRGPKGGELRTTRLREASDFSLGLYADEPTGRRNAFRVQDAILPALSGPHGKNQLFSDVQETHARAFEAATRNPLGKRITKIIGQFVLGRGLMGKIGDERHQEVWDDFWDRNDLSLDIKVIFRDLITFGEIFLRYYNQPVGLVVRSLDPSTIWDIITEPDDIKSVLYYHQQYVVSNFVFSAFVVDRPASTLIIRQIPAKDLDHFKINATGSEKRGRSELYAILGWLIRIKEFMNDRIILNKMRAMFALDVKVTGGPTELSTAEAQFATPPDSGSVLVHNDAVEVEYKSTNTNANEAQTDANMFLKIIAVGSGVSESFLGVSQAATRAGALIQTEPDVKNFEDHQEIVEAILRRAYRRVAVKLPKTKARFEVSFPSIAQEDRSAKLKDLALAQAMEWLSARRAAGMAAKEFSVTDYDYTEEQVVVRGERTADVMVAQGFQSLPKIAPDPLAGDETPALAGPPKFPESPGHPGEPKGLSHTSGQMGFSGRRGGRDLADTRPTLHRSSFSRGTERASIKGRKSAGAPTYESADGAPKSRVWSAAARAKSLATRRANADKRRAARQAALDGEGGGGRLSR